MVVTLQGSLFDAVDHSALGLVGEGIRRVELSPGAWVDHRPGWLSGAEQLFDALHRDVPWHAQRREMYERVVDVPRLTKFYEEDDPLPHPLLAQARGQLSQHYLGELGEHFATLGLCLYRDGRDSVAWHGDRFGRSATQDTLVAILSVGAARPLLLRPSGGGTSLRFAVGHGDLIVMGGSCQRTWDHCVPKTNRAVGPRISIQFRTRGVR